MIALWNLTSIISPFSYHCRSLGKVNSSTDAGVVSVEEGVLEFSWAPTNREHKAQWNDQVMMLAFIPEKDTAIYITAGVGRDRGHDILTPGTSFSGKMAETYLAFISDDRKRISNSQYLGQVMVL